MRYPRPAWLQEKVERRLPRPGDVWGTATWPDTLITACYKPGYVRWRLLHSGRLQEIPLALWWEANKRDEVRLWRRGPVPPAGFTQSLPETPGVYYLWPWYTAWTQEVLQSVDWLRTHKYIAEHPRGAVLQWTYRGWCTRIEAQRKYFTEQLQACQIAPLSNSGKITLHTKQITPQTDETELLGHYVGPRVQLRPSIHRRIRAIT